ncbi:MAG TPA: class A beta-lactamase [Bryobacteraceae bacterium]|nr:class A beta-lactamase [Bryobacteraceae bacterium]
MRFTRRECLLGLSAGSIALAFASTLGERWREIASETDGAVGAAARLVGSDHTVHWNGDQSFPLASVCKLPIAMNLLAMVDEGKIAIDQSVRVLPQDVYPEVSEVAKRWPQRQEFPLSELLELMVAKSDNTAVQTLFRIGGGAPALAARFQEWRVAGIRIDRSEEQITFDTMGVEHYPPIEQWTGDLFLELTAKTTPEMRYRGLQRLLTDPRDSATPEATVQLLSRLFQGEVLSQAGTARLVEILKSTTTFPTRLKGLLPPGTIVAHKTGSSGTEKGLTGATNDVGVIFLPNAAGQLAVAVYLRGSTRDGATRDRIIARMARAAFDAWTTGTPRVG